jgi:energy-coupling factor transporter ATP-binding protein EcfA2
LKINHDFAYQSDNNQMVYDQIQNLFGEMACWFLDSMHFEGEKLILSPFLVSSEPKTYKEAKIRVMHWNGLQGDHKKTKSGFIKFLIEVRQVQTESTAKKYVSKLQGAVTEWFRSNEIVDGSFDIFNLSNDINQINQTLDGPLKEEWKVLNENSGGHERAPWNHWCEFITYLNIGSKAIEVTPIMSFSSESIKLFKKTTFKSGLNFSLELINRYVASLQAKPFVILSGLSGSGKTKLAESFAMYISENSDQLMLVPVGADWTNRDSLLGFENTITKGYSLPPYNVPEFVKKAGREENKKKPYFLILDEMNLSVVERYFADFLSAMESSNKEISLHQIEKQENEKQKLPPKKLKLAPNLFIIGTVNIDESTYMFSPKVLDRANTIEFRLNEHDIVDFLKKDVLKLNLDELVGKGKGMAASFVQNCRKELDKDVIKKIDDLLIETFKPLRKAGAEFGYRTITEIRQLATQLNQFEIELEEFRAEKDGAKTEMIFDIAILQKLLPKLHGSVGKLKAPLTTLAELCFDEGKWDVKYFNKENDEWESSQDLRYPLSFEKIKSMYVRLLQNGFVSFAEA